jgi:hypothetical protein
MQADLPPVVICAFTVICRHSTEYIPSARPDSKYVETRNYTILEYSDGYGYVFR